MNKKKKLLKERIVIPFKKSHPNAVLPQIINEGDAGADARIFAFKKIKIGKDSKELIDIETESYTLKPLERIACTLGFATAIPKGFYFKVVPRSGLALWNGISIVNSPGTIDSGYRNEWMAIVINLSNEEFTLHKGDRICQLILSKLYEYEVLEVEELPESKRGLGGFGSTGKG